jgi:hypothetical protein
MATAAMTDRETVEDPLPGLLFRGSNVDFDADGATNGEADADGTIDISEIVVKGIQSESNLEFQTELETESPTLRKQAERVGSSFDPASA